ncbi:cell wall hydrolase [Allosphingosinicella sp.]|jgi:spore germination cell wall hydrolase CwlJ-like protein|uniref:cell wall hydrolase n=1 Tax=Allosphingosinicella sp. TaxID=2823234 RepID=UPI002F1CBA18
MLATATALYAVAGLSVSMTGAATSKSGDPRADLAAAAGPNAQALLAPHAVRAIAPNDAQTLNASIPIAGIPNPAASPFALRFASEGDRMRSLQCLTEAVYYESATEPLDGQRAVAQVILNRLRHPAYPNTVCGVVYQGHERRTGCQFTFTCDGSLGRAPMPALWARAREVAQEALAGSVYRPVGWATHYHANYVVPYWASSLVKSANIGAHIFYRWTGGWGRPNAFSDRYAGIEPSIVRRRSAPPPLPGTEEAVLASVRAAEAAKAAAAGQGPVPTGSVDSFQSAVLRRYEPLRRDTANAMITERAKSDSTLSASQRWALTGDPASGSTQAPLGRRNPNAAAAEPEPKAAEPAQPPASAAR